MSSLHLLFYFSFDINLFLDRRTVTFNLTLKATKLYLLTSYHPPSSLSFSLSFCHTLTHTQIQIHTHKDTHSHSNTHIHTQTHTHTHTHINLSLTSNYKINILVPGKKLVVSFKKRSQLFLLNFIKIQEVRLLFTLT